MNNITKLLNIEDDQISVINTWTDGQDKFVEIIKKTSDCYCPVCHNRMLSKGIYTRKINHSILLDGFRLSILLHQRRWHCKECNYYCNDEFSFVSPYKRQTNILPFMIVNSLKDHNVTIADVARRFNVSDTYARDIFMSYVSVPRTPLPEVLCIDEVFLDISYDKRYACVLMDFQTREIVDILPNRWKTTLDKYFLSIPREERLKVKYIICDMYDTYVSLPNLYFPNAVVITDSFHVISNLNNKINTYINSVKKKYDERDKKALAEKNRKNNTDYKSSKKSKEVNILTNFRRFLLGNMDTLEYRTDSRYDKYLHCYANDYDREKAFLDLDDRFVKLRDLKQEYLSFNSKFFENLDDAATELDELIQKYSTCDESIFNEFAYLLKRYRTSILASFAYYELDDGTLVRLSNGPMEGFNRIPKDMKRDARGFEVFEYIRARLIFASRKNVHIRATPRSKEEIPRSNEKYRKNKKK